MKLIVYITSAEIFICQSSGIGNVTLFFGSHVALSLWKSPKPINSYWNQKKYFTVNRINEQQTMLYKLVKCDKIWHPYL